MHKKLKEVGGGKPRTVKHLMGSRKATLVVVGFIRARAPSQRKMR